MNRRIRQQARALFRRKNPDYFATRRGEDGRTYVIFVPRSQREFYREAYGDKIKFWDDKKEDEQ